MGSICPCRRDPELIPKKTLIDSFKADTRPVEDTLVPRISDHNEEEDLQVMLKAEENILRLVGPVDLYYRKIAAIRSSTVFERYLAEYIGTIQPCVMDVVPKNDGRNRGKFKNELFEKLSGLDHPHILRMYEMLQDNDHFYIISEIYEAGQLEDYVKAEGCLSERRAATAIHQVLSALAYAHSQRITHGNVNAKTVVVKTDPGHGVIIVKLSGFENLSLKAGPISSGSMFEAPEHSHGQITEKGDIWSCGALLIYMLTGTVTSCEAQSNHLFQHFAFSADIWEALSPKLMDLVTMMLGKKPESRPSALECIAHPWVQQFAYVRPVTSKQIRASIGMLREAESPASLKEAMVWFVISRVMKESEIGKLAEAFRSLDINGDGLISEEELLFSFRKIMPEEKAIEEAKRVIAKVDKNLNGMIDYSEFLHSSFSQNQLLSINNLKLAFDTLDVDGSGAISIQELKRFFVLNCSKRIDYQWRKLISKFDTSGDGEIDFREFQALMANVFNS